MARADEWPAPQVREVFSRSRGFFVRVTPGNDWAGTVGFKGSPAGPHATAEFYRREADQSYRLAATTTLLNPVAPVDFLVTDGGSLVTLDNWHNMGYGPVVCLYTAQGRLVKSYELADLFTKSEIEAFRHSVSSIWWRKSSGAYVNPGDVSVYVTIDDKGAGLVIDASTGVYQYCENRTGGLGCRESNANRVWKPYRDPKIP